MLPSLLPSLPRYGKRGLHRHRNVVADGAAAAAAGQENGAHHAGHDRIHILVVTMVK